MSPIASSTGLAVQTQAIHSKLGDPPCTIRSPRRLFPQRRTTWSTLNASKLASFCGYLPDKPIQTTEYDAVDYEQDCSDDGSSSSSGTVKLGALSKLDLPDPNSWLPLEECYPIKQLYTPYLPHHTEEKLGNASHQMCPSTPNTTSNGLDDAFISPSNYTKPAAQCRVRINSRPTVCGSGPSLRFKTSQSLPNLREASNQSELEYRHSTQSEGAIYRVTEWDASVQLCTMATKSEKGVIEIHHHAQISVIIPKQMIDTARICLNLIVAHRLRGNYTRHLEAGHSSLYFNDEPSTPPFPDSARAEIEITRDICDMEKPLHLYFASIYTTSDHHKNMQVLPSFRPSNGRVLSESVFLGEPVAPLVIKTTPRSMYSTWKATPHPLSKVTQFERIDTPPLYPLGLRDDLRIEVMELSAVRFQSLGVLAATDVVWNFDIRIQQLRGMELECRMSLYLEVGMTSNRLVTIDPNGWIPSFFLIDGGLATENRAEWRQFDGQLTLFKQAHMLPGPIKLELNWQNPPNIARPNGNKPYDLLLPAVLDCEVLGGSLTCNTIGAAFLDNPETNERFRLEPNNYLPTLHKGYSLYLNRTPKARNPTGQQPTLSPISEDLEANNDTGSDQSFVTPLENRVTDSDPETSSGPSPNPEANNEPPSDEDPHQEGTRFRQNGRLSSFRTVLVFIVMIAVLGNIWLVRSLWLPDLREGRKIRNLPGLRLSHNVENLTHAGLEDDRHSHEVEELVPRADSMDNTRLETLTGSMIAGTESFGEEEVKGWRWCRDVFDYAFGWPGPIHE